MKHPFHIILSDNSGEHLFTASQNRIQVFSISNGDKLGEWIDEADNTDQIKAKVKKEQERQIKENEQKKSNHSEEPETEPSKKKRKSNNSEPKIPTPGEGAPKIYNYIRALHLTNNEKYLVAATDSDKAAVIFDIDLENKENVLKQIKRQPFPKRPSAITSTVDSTEVLLGDKFGDVYSIPIDSNTPREINSESEPILGHVSMLTDLTMGVFENKQYIVTCDRDEHIRVSNYPQGFVIKGFLFGHEQFINKVVIPEFDSKLLISGGGDDNVFLWDWTKDIKLDQFNVKEAIEDQLDEFHLAPAKFQNESNDFKEICVSQIISLNQIKSFAVLIEATKCVLILQIDSDNKLKLNKKILFDDKVVTISASSDKLFISLENGNDQLLKAIDINSLEQDDELSNKQLQSITSNSSVEISSKEELFPLYTAYQLRKRSEH